MQFISKTSYATDSHKIIEDLTSDLTDPFDLGIIFISSFNKVSVDEIVMLLKKRLRCNLLLGCTCAGVIGSEEEIERKPANVLILANFPGVKITPFSIQQSELEVLENKESWYNFFEIYPSENPIFITLPDPFTFDMNRFLQWINQSYPRCPVIGGVASGGFQQGENGLILNDEQLDNGMVGIVLTGNVAVETIVSQGCRPIGETFIVTKSQENIIFDLGGKPFLEILQEVLHKASARDKLLAQETIFVGIAMNEYQHQFKRGDFLIRGLVGLDRKTGAGAIADVIKTGQTVQFHVRDAQTATEDLSELLTALTAQNKEKPKGALVFSCNGRGENLFRTRNHDIKLIQQHLGPIPAGGFFCAGEIGPVCQDNFLHGFTDSIALFYPKR